MGCKLLEIMADVLYAIFRRFEAVLKKKVAAQAVTIGCPSNGRRASSITALPAPAAQTSVGGTACSLLRLELALVFLSFLEPRYQSSRRLLTSPTNLHKQTKNS